MFKVCSSMHSNMIMCVCECTLQHVFERALHHIQRVFECTLLHVYLALCNNWHGHGSCTKKAKLNSATTHP